MALFALHNKLMTRYVKIFDFSNNFVGEGRVAIFGVTLYLIDPNESEPP